MKPIIPNPKEPFKVDVVQLTELDNRPMHLTPVTTTNGGRNTTFNTTAWGHKSQVHRPIL